MRASLLHSMLALTANFAVTLAQTPPGFKPATANNLQVHYPNLTVTTGDIVPQADIKQQPVLALQSAGSSSYIGFIIDVSLVLSPGSPPTTLVHWAEPGLHATSGSSSLAESVGALVPYIPPTPPPGQTHDYVVVLFQQPSNFTLPSNWATFFSNITASVTNRIGFNLTQFTDAAGLAEPVAANWFRVSQPAASSTQPSGTNSSSASNTAAITKSGPTTVPTSSGSKSFVLGEMIALGFAAAAFTTLAYY